jgi:hypothetical protein
LNIDFFQRRKTQLEDALLLKNQAVDMLDYLKTHCISSDQYCAIRDCIEEAAKILESDLEYANNKLQSAFRPKHGLNNRLTRAQSKMFRDREY